MAADQDLCPCTREPDHLTHRAIQQHLALAAGADKRVTFAIEAVMIAVRYMVSLHDTFDGVES